MISTRDAAFIACRLIAVFHITQWASGILWAFKEIMGLVATSIAFGEFEFSHSFVNIVPAAVVHLAVIAFLWFGAGLVAGWVTPRREEEPAVNHWDRKSAFSFVVVAVGLVILLLNLPILVRWVYVLKGNENVGQWLDTQFFTTFVYVLIGLVCLVGAGTIARAVGHLRRW